MRRARGNDIAHVEHKSSTGDRHNPKNIRVVAGDKCVPLRKYILLTSCEDIEGTKETDADTSRSGQNNNSRTIVQTPKYVR